MTTRRFKKALPASLCLGILAGLVTVPVLKTHAQGAAPRVLPQTRTGWRWLRAASSRCPASSRLQRRSRASLTQVLVKANETVFAGQPLIRLRDQEARAQLASVAAQVAMRKRIRNKESAASGAAARRKAEDAVADAEAAVLEVQSLR